MNVLHRFGFLSRVLPRFGLNSQRPALTWGQFPASCLDLGSISCVLPRLGDTSLRSASIWDQFAALCAFCFDLGLTSRVLPRFGVEFPSHAGVRRAPYSIFAGHRARRLRLPQFTNCLFIIKTGRSYLATIYFSFF